MAVFMMKYKNKKREHDTRRDRRTRAFAANRPTKARRLCRWFLEDLPANAQKGATLAGLFSLLAGSRILLLERVTLGEKPRVAPVKKWLDRSPPLSLSPSSSPPSSSPRSRALPHFISWPRHLGTGQRTQRKGANTEQKL
jgi:hypothetical protein